MKPKYLLAVSLGVWIFFACLQVGYDSPDEHFPTFEAVSFILFGKFEATWEWHYGLRSWIQPAIEALWLWPFHALGIEDRILLDHLSRFFMALLSFPLLLSFRSIAKSFSNENSTEKPLSSLPFLVGIFALFWPLILWGTRHGSDNFCIPFLYSGLALCFLREGKSWQRVLGGLLLSLSFSIRFTSAIPILFALLFSSKLWRRSWAWILFGASIGMLVVNEVDRYFYWKWMGSWHIPFVEFFRYNILLKSVQFHRSPWWEPPLQLVGLLFPTWLILFSGLKKPLFKNNPLLIWSGASLASCVAVFSWVKHFETRFLFPILPFAVFFIFSNLQETVFSSPKIFKKIFVLNGIILILLGFFYSNPREGFIRMIENGSKTLKSGEKLRINGASSHIPNFYSHQKDLIAPLHDNDLNEVCESGGPFDYVSPLVLLTQKVCRNCACEKIYEFEEKSLVKNLLNRNRKNYFVYRCLPSTEDPTRHALGIAPGYPTPLGECSQGVFENSLNRCKGLICLDKLKTEKACPHPWKMFLKDSHLPVARTF